MNVEDLNLAVREEFLLDRHLSRSEPLFLMDLEGNLDMDLGPLAGALGCVRLANVGNFLEDLAFVRRQDLRVEVNLREAWDAYSPAGWREGIGSGPLGLELDAAAIFLH